MKILIAALFVLMGFSFSSKAAVELTLNPTGGYLAYDGFRRRMGSGLDFQLDDHFQLGGSAELFVDNVTVISLGPTYNFSTDLIRSSFVSLGPILAMQTNTTRGSIGGGYARVGTRFLLLSDLQICFKPFAQVLMVPGFVAVGISPLSFSIQF